MIVQGHTQCSASDLCYKSLTSVFIPLCDIYNILYKDVAYAKHSSHFHQSLCCTIVLQQFVAGKLAVMEFRDYVKAFYIYIYTIINIINVEGWKEND